MKYYSDLIGFAEIYLSVPDMSLVGHMIITCT